MTKNLYGRLALFSSKETFLTAIATLEENKVRYQTYSSYEMDELTQRPGSLFEKKNIVKKAALIGACFGLSAAIFMQWFATVVGTPLNIAGKPLDSWPAYIPISFVVTVLCTGLSIILTLFYQLKLPEPYHPIFNSQYFDLSVLQYGILVRSSELTSESISKNLWSTFAADSVEDLPC